MYPTYATPWESFSKLQDAGQYLKPGFTMNDYKLKADAESDTEAARGMQLAKQKLFANLQPARANK